MSWKLPHPWLQLLMPGKLHPAEVENPEQYLTPFAEKFWGGYNIDDIYDAFASAETGSFNDSWIRTVAENTPGGSTAYGPVQITGGLIDDFYNNERNIFDDNSDIAQTLRGQAALFSHFGNEEGRAGYDSKYDYSGGGIGLTDIQKVQYKDFAQDMMSDMWSKNENKTNPVQSFIEAWRGVPEDEDPDYYKRFNTNLGR